ncbi:MAG: type II secretion system protein [Candidatus Gottesmanbacteria bacterium]
MKKGFSLIEMLVAIGLMASVGSIAMIILFTSIKGANKGDVMRDVKQNGEYAISMMENMIRSAKSATCNGADQLTILNTDKYTTTFSLVGNKIASEGATTTGNYLTNDKVVVSGLTFNCTKPQGAPPFVKMNFTVTQANLTTTLAEEKASLDFQTTVSLRTY